MSTKDPRIDAYIAKSGDFAKPILQRIRKLVHELCPDVEETLKWSAPHFLYKGILMATPAFKQHCALIFWKGRFFLPAKEKARLRKMTSLADLPGDKILKDYIKQAIKLNEDGIKSPRSKPAPKKPLVVPDYFQKSLSKNKKALAAFEDFSPSHKREYVEWITEAKREETRAKRIETALEWMAKGKSRHWKYQKC